MKSSRSVGHCFMALLSDDGKPQNPEQRLHLEMLHYLDDRHWPVKVWYHNRLPNRVRRSWILSTFYYTWRLVLAPAITLIIDYRLYPYLGWALPMIRSLRKHRIVLSVPGAYDQPGRLERITWNRRLAWWWCLRCADVLIADSKFTRQDLAAQGVDSEKIRVLRFSQDWISYWPRRDAMVQRPLRVLTVLSRLAAVEEELFFTAIRQIPVSLQLYLGLFGDPRTPGSQALYITRMIEKNCLGKSVAIVSWRSTEERQRALAESDVFVMPHMDDIQGNAVLEAVGAGLPVIGIHDDTISDIVQNQVTGLILPETTPAALAKALERLHNNRQVLNYFATQSRIHARRMNPSWKKTRKRFGNLMETIAH